MVDWITTSEKVDYLEACQVMEKHVFQMNRQQAPEQVWLLEHDPVYTMGTSGSEAEILDLGNIPLFRSGRGGKITYHGPGQRVGYVMLDLNKRGKDLRQYIWNLEEWLIRTLEKFKVEACRRSGRIGLWVTHPNKGEAKIAAIGVRIRKWITFHGFSLNMDPDLSCFERIIPCGIQGYGVTSLKDMGVSVTMEEIDLLLKRTFSEVFNEAGG